MTKTEAMQTLRLIANAVVETVKEAGPDGAPGGPMYLAFMAYGISLNGFQQIMAGLVDAKQIVRRGDCYFPA